MSAEQTNSESLSGREGLQKTVELKKKMRKVAQKKAERDATKALEIPIDPNAPMTEVQAKATSDILITAIVKPPFLMLATAYDKYAKEAKDDTFTFALSEAEGAQLKLTLEKAFQTIPYGMLAKILPWIGVVITCGSICGVRIVAAAQTRRFYKAGKHNKPKEKASDRPATDQPRHHNGKTRERKDNHSSRFGQMLADEADIHFRPNE